MKQRIAENKRRQQLGITLRLHSAKTPGSMKTSRTVALFFHMFTHDACCLLFSFLLPKQALSVYCWTKTLLQNNRSKIQLKFSGHCCSGNRILSPLDARDAQAAHGRMVTGLSHLIEPKQQNELHLSLNVVFFVTVVE